MASNASSTIVVVSTHVSRRYIVFLLHCRFGWWELQENSVDVILQLLEQWTSVYLKSWIFEVGADLKNMSSQECRNVVLPPLVIPLLLFEGFGNLSLKLDCADRVTDQKFGVFISDSDW